MGKINFGWRIPAFPVSRTEEREFITQILNSLEKIENNFDSAWICDHMIPWPNWQRPDMYNLESWTTINYLMGIFRNLSFGHIVLCNSYREPSLLAKMVSTLCTFSPGRFILGIGAGWKKDEYLSYGYKFLKDSSRIEALKEAVQILRQMWTRKTVSFNGKYYKISNAFCVPKPRPIPPIMIGGGGEKLTLRVVAEHADWWNYGNLTLEEYSHKLEILKNHCDIVGRKYANIKKTWLGCIAVSESNANVQKILQNSPFITREERFNAMQTTLFGKPEVIIQKLVDFVDLGVEYFIFRFLDFPSTVGLELFIEQISSEFK